MQDLEILAPAGSFEAGIAAFRGGADAVYLGLSDFSARKSAKNFSRDNLLALKKEAVGQKKKIYVTLNTLVKDSELNAVLDAASFLDEIETDGVILQDLGLASTIKKLFPSLPLHASTQMAVHTADGVKFLKRLGFTRVVLSREVPLKKIAEIKKAVPDMELEVFVHGALCYSFSGLCLASGMLLNRSGNRGMCAQICRSFYETEDGREGYFFSCNDLMLKDHLDELAAAGVNSFKIEGRMKDPEYVFYTSALYHAAIRHDDTIEALKNSRISFARESTEGYLRNFNGEKLVSSDFPGHRGVKLGVCEKRAGRRFLLRTKYALGLHDGILFFKNNNRREPFVFSIEEIAANSGKILKTVGAGERIWLRGSHLPEINDEIFLVSSRFLDLKKINPAAFKPWKKGIDIDAARCGEDTIRLVSGDFRFEISGLPIERSEHRSNFTDNLSENLKNSGDSLYTLNRLSSDGSCEYIFLNPSLTKKIRKDFYAAYAEYTDKEKAAKIDSELLERSQICKGNTSESLDVFKKRELFNPDGNIPFFMNCDDFSLLKKAGGYSVIPLLPLMKRDIGYLDRIETYVVENRTEKFLIGLSNIGQLEFAQRLMSQENVLFFADFPLYIANSKTFGFLRNLLGDKLLFGYSWIENREEDLFENGAVLKISDTFNPPLFISAGCFERSNGLKRCELCKGGKSVRKLKNMDRTFQVISKDCVSFMFKI